MGTPWSRVVNTTIRNYIREEEVNILRNRKLLALLQKKGRISFNHSGVAMDWKVRFRRVPLQQHAEGDTLTFGRQDRHKTAVVEWRGYAATDAMFKSEFLQNRGAEAIINLFATRSELLKQDLEDNFGEEIYKDGTLPANSKGMHGIESFMQVSGSNAGGNGAMTPNGTYAGLSTVPGYFGGTWSAPSGLAWPHGRGDAQYDFWSPLIIDVGDTYFGAITNPSNPLTNNKWSLNAVEAVAFAIIKGKKSQSETGKLDVIFVAEAMYQPYLSLLRTKERIIVERNNQVSPLVALGFTDVINQDGTDITWEYGSPSGAAYGFNCDQMQLCSQQAQLFAAEGPDFDIASSSWRWSFDFYGNMKWNPRHQLKMANFTNTSDAI